jgi:hypothetical protein
MMRSRPNSVRSLVIILAFLLAFYGKLIFSDFVTISISSSLLKMVYFYAWWLVPIFLASGILFGFRNLAENLGLGRGLLIGIFLITAVGAAWFAWLYTEWDNNLWVPVFMHVLMNLSWTLFEVSSTALGGGLSNVFRAITIALTIFITIYYHRRSGLRITGKNLVRQGLR